MLEALLAEAGVPVAALRMGVLYRGPAADAAAPAAADRARQEAREPPRRWICSASPDALLEVVADQRRLPRLGADLVTGPHSVGRTGRRRPASTVCRSTSRRSATAASTTSSA